MTTIHDRLLSPTCIPFSDEIEKAEKKTIFSRKTKKNVLFKLGQLLLCHVIYYSYIIQAISDAFSGWKQLKEESY